jgi:hypothetical protein
MTEVGAVNRQLHPLVTILLGGVFGGPFGAWIAWDLARSPTGDTALWGGVIGTAVGAGMFGTAHGVHWLYHTVPTIRTYTKGAFALGAAAGFLLSLVGCLASLFTGHGVAKARPAADAYLVGALVGAVGFVLGCLVAVGRVILRRRGRSDSPAGDRSPPPG